MSQLSSFLGARGWFWTSNVRINCLEPLSLGTMLITGDGGPLLRSTDSHPHRRHHGLGERHCGVEWCRYRWCSGLPVSLLTTLRNFSSFPSVWFLGGLGYIFLSAFHAWATDDWCGSQALATTAQLPTPGTIPFLPSPVPLPF